jgi:hypothetical protein
MSKSGEEFGGSSKERNKRGRSKWELGSRKVYIGELWEIQEDTWIGAFIHYSKPSSEHLLCVRYCTRHRG